MAVRGCKFQWAAGLCLTGLLAGGLGYSFAEADAFTLHTRAGLWETRSSLNNGYSSDIEECKKETNGSPLPSSMFDEKDCHVDVISTGGYVELNAICSGGKNIQMTMSNSDSTRSSGQIITEYEPGRKLIVTFESHWVGACPDDMQDGRLRTVRPSNYSPGGAVSATPLPQPPLIAMPQWIKQPIDDDYAKYYPLRAKQLGAGGRVTLNCAVTGAGTLADCTVAEDKPGYGFGDATLRIAKLFKMAPQTADGLPVTGGRFMTVIIWKTGTGQTLSSASSNSGQ